MQHRLSLAILTMLAVSGAGIAVGSAASTTGIHSTLVMHVTGSPAVGDIDQHVLGVMKANDVHAASLAIIDGRRLIYAKGYALGTIATPVVQPTTYFRQASVSKLITALAVMQLISDGNLRLDTKMNDVLHLRQPNGKPPHDKRFDRITIQDLLEMHAGIPDVTESDATIAHAVGKRLPVTPADIGAYAASQSLMFSPNDVSMACYDNSDYQFLGFVVAKVRGASSMVAAIEDPMFKPLHITRIRGARALKSQQLPNEATYDPNPYQTARSVMTPSQPTVELGYGELNFENDQGAGGLSAAATDMARVLAAINLETENPAFRNGMIADWLRRAYGAYHGGHLTCHDSQGSADAHGYYGLDDLSPARSGGNAPPYWGQKGGYLSTSQNAIYFRSGRLGYVINWSGHTTSGESWYPIFESVLKAARAHKWGTTDLFPAYGMPPLK
jgi:CubicO group peptidase (beta-lactamase class C family)